VTEDQFLTTIREAIAKGTDYDGSAQAMVDCAVAAFNYAADQVGATGFQAGWAALTAYGKEMHIECPFGVLRADELVYPQYDLLAEAQKWISEWRPWAAGQAKKNLAGDHHFAAARVLSHWEALAADFPDTPMAQDDIAGAES
jgi:hypothetical protein